MKIRKSGAWVLWYECFGFGLILLLTWLNELTNLPSVVTGHPHYSNIRYNLIETAVILLIWGLVFLLTRRLVAHLHHLEGFLRVCAWCRKVAHQDKWFRLEDYFSEGFNIETTHGMCPDCLKKVEEDTKRYYRDEAERQRRTESNAGAPPQTGTSKVPGTTFAAIQVPNAQLDLRGLEKKEAA